MSEPEGGEEEDRDESVSERPDSERGSPPQRRCSRCHRCRGGGSPEEKERKPPPLLGLAVLMSSLSASMITSCVSSVPFLTPRVQMQFSLLKSSAAISPDLFFSMLAGLESLPEAYKQRMASMMEQVQIRDSISKFGLSLRLCQLELKFE
ncbi:uncharacterized protein DS421_16g546250 [Arachis hypogaea]|nr:uncharacterized protein DS421_16g546250 [Arachis hypogaea]